MKVSTLCVLAGIALAPAAAMGQWADNFDTYTAGSINAQGGWKGWDNTASAAGNVVTAVARSGPHSQAIVGAADSVHTYSGVTSGQWSYTAWQYIPQGFTGLTNFILNNVYNDGGPYQWAVQLGFNSATGLVTDDNGRTEVPINYVVGQWAEIRVDFDLTANTISEYYNGTLLSSGAWAAGVTPVLALGGVDLFANTGSVVYYDDMSLRQIPAPGSLGLLGLAGLVAARRRRA
jgi:hypothetical protein